MGLVAFLAALFAQADPPKFSYQIVCHPGNAVTTVERQFLADAFLKKVRAWPGGDVIKPVDLLASSPVRRLFSETIVRRPVDAILNFWQQCIFSGHDVPPPELDTDDEVISFVLRSRGAIGYVSGTANLRGARILTVK